jgi:ribose transport system ATP-binding protein
MAECVVEEIITMKNISKSFPGVRALADVSLSVKRGEVHGLVGENGAGKSTLIKILTGAYQKDQGEILVEGKKVDIKSPMDSKRLGISAVYQDISLAVHLSVAENFFLGDLPLKNKYRVDWKTMNRITGETLEKLDIKVNPKMRLKDLPVAKQEMVAIAKAVHDKSKLIIFDEPTALLTNTETEELFGMVQRLKDEGLGIIYISHRLEEIFGICDAVTVLKDGERVDTVPITGIDENRLISMMVGRDLSDMYNIKHFKSDEVVLEVKDLAQKGIFSDINFTLHRGEILGMFGLVGSGRTDIVSCLFGAKKATSGKVKIKGKSVWVKCPSQAIREGIGFLPENRKTQGLALPLTVRENTNLAIYKLISTLGVINKRKEKDTAERYRESLNTKTPSIEQKVKNLSGGNQQKVVIGRWLARNSDILIFDEPTVGVDVGAKMEIYKVLEKLLEEGKSIIFISSYLPEVIGVSERVLVISEGKQMGIVDKSEATEEKLLRMASGIPG